MENALNEWVRQGVSLHENRDNCAFCGNAITDERWQIIHAHFDEESRKLESEIDHILKSIETEKDAILETLKIDKSLFYSRYHKQLDELNVKYKTESQKYIENLNEIKNQLANKKSKVTNVLTFITPTNCSNNLKAIFDEYCSICDDSNNFSNELEKSQNAARNSLRLQEVADFCNVIDYSKLKQEIDDLMAQKNEQEIETTKIQERIAAYVSELKEKRTQLMDEEKGADCVNQYLNNYFGHKFLTLQPEDATDGGAHITFNIIRNEEIAFNLSEGERSLIAFCYFMAKLDDIETKGKKPIIWIDDPISSLDSNHIFFMYSLIVSVIANTGNFEQLFLSTHNLDFLKYLKRLNSPIGSKQYFLIERDGKQSKIIKMPKYLKEYATEFNYLFSQIYKCSKLESITDENFPLRCNFENNARKFFETYLYFCYPDDSKEFLPKLKKFFAPEDIPPILIDRLYNEGSHGSIERSLRVDDIPEAVPAAKKIIEKLKENKEQFNALLTSIGEQPIE